MSIMTTTCQYFFMLFVDSIINSLQEHHNQQSNEQQKLYKHHKKCYDSPHKYMGLISDGMDEKKNSLATFCPCAKEFKGGKFY